jgi:response regulator RpfG family c-di-GMP phosphodiesterase
LAARTARSAGLDAERCGLIERASPLHDVGKVAIPDSVLLKPGPLTPAERSIVETHAEIGHRPTNKEFTSRDCHLHRHQEHDG